MGNKNNGEKFVQFRVHTFCVEVNRISKKSPRYDVEITQLSKTGKEIVAHLVVNCKDENFETFVTKIATGKYYWMPLSLLQEARQFAIDFFNPKPTE